MAAAEPNPPLAAAAAPEAAVEAEDSDSSRGGAQRVVDFASTTGSRRW